MNDIDGQIGLVMKETCKILKDTHFICKIPFFLKKIEIHLSSRLLNCIPEICLNVQKVDYQGAESKSFFQIPNRVGYWS